MNITVKTRHMESSEAIKSYVESKAGKLTKFYNQIMSIEAVLDIEADQPMVELVVTAARKHTFVASHRGPDMYAAVDQCVDRLAKQLRRHKDKVRDRQGPTHEEMNELGGS